MDVFTKIDLHIHSAASGKTKNGDLEITKNSTINNVNVLLDKLNDDHNQINMCAITDHNIFDCELYLKLKENEMSGKYLKKVLPGVELDLEINGTIAHTICIFSDENPDHAMIIKNAFFSQEKYSLTELGKLLSKIGLDVILIAHQKGDYLSEKQRKNNLSSCGLDNFYHMIDVEYFDSLEVQSSKVEGILKNRFIVDSINNQALISGSDCHDWNVYPLHDANFKGSPEPLLLKMKAEASFRGLVMAITNTRRFYVEDVCVKEPFIKEIKITTDGKSKSIPLSSGINVIIGDNSVGKSTLIKSMLGCASKEALDFYKSHKIEVKNLNLKASDYEFNAQGEIRKKFEQNESKLPIKEDFKDLIKEIDVTRYKDRIKKIFTGFINLWDDNENRYINNNSLKTHLTVSSYDSKNSYYLSFLNSLSKNNNKFTGFTKESKGFIDCFIEFVKKYTAIFDKDELERFSDIYKFFNELRDKYSKKEIDIIFMNKIINSFTVATQKYQTDTENKKSTEESNYNTYLDTYALYANNIALAAKYSFMPQVNPFDGFENIKIDSIDNQVGDYHFICKMINQIVITKDFIVDYIKKKIDIDDVFKASKSQVLKNISSKRFNDRICNNLNELRDALTEEFAKDFFKTTVEIKHGSDNLNEGNSAGINALYYLDIKSYIYDKKVFIIDQPEDDVSQTKIGSVLLNSLRNFSKKSQVIIITHNPQLVVNLDADNIIVIKKHEEIDEINFINGPLERFDKDVDMIRIVADTLEGGIEVIKKRWKRYDKANRTSIRG